MSRSALTLFALPALLSLAACGRGGGEQAASRASASASASAGPVGAATTRSIPPAAESAAPAAASTVGFALESTTGSGTKTDVWLIGTSLELREKIAAVAPDVGCVLGAVGNGWAVFCADTFPTPVASLRRADGGLALERLGAPSRAITLPAGATVVLGTSEGGARLVPGQACADAAKTRPLKALVSTRNIPPSALSNAKIAVVEGGRTLAWSLPTVAANVTCRVTDPGDGTTQLVCAKEPVCTFKGTNGRLEITCGEARSLIFLRCGSVPAVEVGSISRSVMYE